MKIFTTLIISFLFSITLLAQENEYKKQWREVTKFELEQLPKSALEIVTQIETKAKADNNQVQLIKTLLFKSKFALILEEDAQLKVINDFKDLISETEAPTKNVLQNMLAKVYWDYFSNNRYKFYNRTKTENKVDSVDFRTWDLETLFSEIAFYYDASLQNETLLKNTTTLAFEPLLITFKDSNKLRPTLFDFLAHNALEFYKTTENAITKPVDAFTISDPLLSGNVQEFQGVKITSKDSASLQLKALKIYQDLIKFHASKNNEIPLAAVDVERLKFVNSNNNIPNIDTLFRASLESGKNTVSDQYAKAIYDFKIAEDLHSKGQLYTDEDKESDRWAFKKAVTICENIIENTSETYVAEQAKNLKEIITTPTLTLQLESFLPIESDSRMLVLYANVSSMNISVYKISEEQNESFKLMYDKEKKRAFINKLPLQKQWTQALRDEGDYRSHSTEILLNGFPQGRYLVMASPTNEENKRLFETTQIQFTDLALIKSQDEDATFFQVVNRNNGKPIANAAVTITYYKKNKRTEKFTTNAKGFFKIPQDREKYRNFLISVKHKNEEANFGNQYNYYNNYKQESQPYKSFLFTDRSIYRPGQIIYFKGIVAQTANEKSSVLAGQEVFVTLYDANGEDVSDLDLKTNEYGTVAGEFVLPSGLLTGQFYLELASLDKKSLRSTSYIRVEEYKRPKFETKLKSITETYKINDSITVNGEALSFSGSTISNAKVVYTVTRKVQYPRWYYWGRPQNYGAGQEITFGETTTNNKGEYSINFKAIPDATVDKKGQPVFQYEVKADVTDINGETQSTTTIVRVGYHAITIDLQVPEKLEAQNKKHLLKLKTENLNGEKVAAAVDIAIYKLKAPNTVLRNRPWNAPDYQEFSETEFKKLFPNDPYKNEDELQNWEQGAKVFNKTVTTSTTEKTTDIDFGNIKKWESGAYVVIAKTKDKFGQEVLAKSYTIVFDKKDKTPADNQLFSIDFNKETFSAGDAVMATLKSNAAITVTLTVEKNSKIIETYIVTLDSNAKTISVPVNTEDVGGFAIHYSFTAFNSYVGGSKLINVPAPKMDLSIETKTFRNKLEPGVPETWSFKVKGPDGEKVSAELLASMYDVSLDQFTPHQWAFNPQPSLQYRMIGSPSAGQSFGTRSLYLQFGYRIYANPAQNFDRFEWFGFSINDNSYNYNRYVNKLSSKFRERYSVGIKKGFLKGIIYDQNGLPLPGVNVIVKGTTNGTQTDFDGLFEIQVEKGDELIISYVGFNTQSYTFKDNNSIELYLSEGNALNELVITGYGGITRERKSLGYSVTTLESESLESAPEDEVVRSLNGKVAGVAISAGLMNEDNAVLANSLVYTDTVSGGLKKTDFSSVKIRKNLQETAFFFPQLRTNKNGDISFEFTTPEALTKWKLQLLAHTKDLDHAVASFKTVTQKELMVVPNAPRFLREGDEIIISSKISNLSDTELKGQAMLQLNDAITGESIDVALDNSDNVKNFSVSEKNNTQVSWRLKIPSTVQAVEYKVIAKTDTFSDGEQNTLPVLSNRMLVTETLPMWVRSNETKTFRLDKLADNTSTTLKHHKLTLEVTSNPAWYAVQALPYLMEYPYECNEQTFARYYANSLASHIANSNPRIKAVFDQWVSSDALLSNLEKNDELKSLLIQETPWVRDAQSETEQKKRIALLFDLNLMQRNQKDAITKLSQNQISSGAWPWFNGGYENRYITQHIVSGFGHLKKLGVFPSAPLGVRESEMIKNALNYLDAEFVEEYDRLSQYTEKTDYAKDHLSRMQTQYLYMRSFFPEIKMSKKATAIKGYYLDQMESYWTTRNIYIKGMMALALHRNNRNNTAKKITASLKENSITNEELGMYWKNNTPSWYWYQAPVETQALMIEVFSEIEKDVTTVDNLKVWLLKNKQTNKWSTTKATSEAVYALLLQGTDWLSVTDAVQVTVGDKIIDPSKLDKVKVEAGTGYFKTSWNTSEISKQMATVTMQKKGEGIAWGGLYWQYFEDLDNITSAETPLQLKKKIFLKKNTGQGEEISEITENTGLKVGDLVRVRIELRADRDMDFVHMKDMRAAGLEPIDVISTYKYQDGLGYYQATKDASTNFFFDTVRKGIYVFEYDLRVNNAGTFSNGITTIQSMYAPEFSSHSEGVRIKVEK